MYKYKTKIQKYKCCMQSSGEMQRWWLASADDVSTADIGIFSLGILLFDHVVSPHPKWRDMKVVRPGFPSCSCNVLQSTNARWNSAAAAADGFTESQLIRPGALA